MYIWILFALIITGSGFVQSSMGFGYAVVALALLPYFIDVRTANLIVSISGLVPLAFGLWAYRLGLDWRGLGHCLAGAAIGLPIGLLVFVYVEADWLMQGTGIVILLTALHDLFTWSRRHAATSISQAWSTVAGTVSGFLAGAVGIGGPPIAAYAVRQSWSPEQSKAFVISFMMTLSLLKAFSLVAAGLIGNKVWMLAAVAVPFGYVGSRLGIVASRKINVDCFRRRTLVMLVLVSFGMIVRGNPSELQKIVHIDRHQTTQNENIPSTFGRSNNSPRLGRGMNYKGVVFLEYPSAGPADGISMVANLERLTFPKTKGIEP